MLMGTGVSATFQYDPNGRRNGKTVNGISTNFLYDGANIVQEQSAQNGTANLLNGGLDELFIRSDNAGSHHAMLDSLGSVLSLTNGTGSIETDYSYDAFGKTATDGISSDNTSQFTGRENDGTSLYFYRARYYNANSQRFLSEDPLRFGGGDINIYAYVANSPLNYKDPTGLEILTAQQYEQSARGYSGPWPPWYYVPAVTVTFTPAITPGLGGGVVITRTGVYPQLVLIDSPGVSASIPLFPANEEPKQGWSTGFSGCYGGCLSVSGENGGGLGSQIGLGTPGGGVPITYTFSPWKWPDIFGRGCRK